MNEKKSKTYTFNQDKLLSDVSKSPVIKYGLYIAGGILAIYLLGKISKVFATSITEFKQLQVALKQ